MSYGPVFDQFRQRGRLRRSHPQGREAGRPPGAAADQVRARHQPQDRQGARPQSAADAAGALLTRSSNEATRVHHGSRRRGGRVAARGARAAAGDAGGRVRPRRSAEAAVRHAARSKGLRESGYIEGQNVMVEYHWLAGQTIACRCLMADLVRRRVAVIVAAGGAPALAAKAATTTIPIVFGFGKDPVKIGSCREPCSAGSQHDRCQFFRFAGCRQAFGLLREWYQGRSDRSAHQSGQCSAHQATARMSEAARALGLQIVVLKASTSREIEAAFANLVRDRADALFVAPGGFFFSRRVQLATLAAHQGCPRPVPLASSS